MSFRLNPFKVIRAIAIVVIIVYGIGLAVGYKNSKVTTTDSITKDMKIRKKDFYKSKDYKNNLTLPAQVVENNNETVAKEIEKAKAAQPVDLQKNSNSNQTEGQQQKNDTNVAEEKKKEEQKRLETQKLEQAKKAEQKRQEAAKQAEREAEIKRRQEAIRKQAEERAKAEAKKKESQAPKGPRKYIQVASVGSEGSAKALAKKLGGQFYYKKTTVNGRTAYVVMSNMTDNPNTLKSMENQAKSKSGGGYMIRSAGK
ncbi:SPOR domain-containing protein [Leptotrichia sp. HSP-536]|uniref:SPOR domain-containing protein n=1 Tax=Leptotrichia alba TaxID=3239304 RepID=A0AB39V5U9_9FUSO